MENNTPILITGAAGFIGCNLARWLQERGHAVTGIDNLSFGWRNNLPADIPLIIGDVADARCWQRVPEIETIVHLAGSSSTPMFVDDVVDAFTNNTRGFLRLLEEARGHFGSFHSRTVLSRLPDRPRLPSDETATPQTQLVWPKNRHTSLQLSTSHSRTVWS